MPQRGHWLLIAVRDVRGSDALGAQVTIRAGGKAVRRDVRTAYSYLAANDPRVHVGLGAVTTVDGRRRPLARRRHGALRSVRGRPHRDASRRGSGTTHP